MARDALTAYDEYRFDTNWASVMNDLAVDLSIWLEEWWTEKFQLLGIAMHREGIDYIRNKLAGKSTSNIRPSVVRMMEHWDPSGFRPVSEFSVTVARRYEYLYFKDHILIESVFEELPTKDSRWQKSQASSVPYGVALQSAYTLHALQRSVSSLRR